MRERVDLEANAQVSAILGRDCRQNDVMDTPTAQPARRRLGLRALQEDLALTQLPQRVIARQPFWQRRRDRTAQNAQHHCKAHRHDSQRRHCLLLLLVCGWVLELCYL